MKPWQNLILTTIFGVMLFLPAISMFCFPQLSDLIDENRTRTSFPKLGTGSDSVQEYCQRFEKYFDDHLGFRDALIAAGLRFNQTLFPTEPISDVLPGRDGWLYLKSEFEFDMISDCLGITTFSQKELQSLQIKLENHRDKLAHQGIQYLFVIAPNKESIYPEHLPAWIHPVNVNKIDMFVDYMQRHSTVNILDLRPPLKRAAASGALYYKTDSHWNLMGAHLASGLIISHLAKQFPGLAAPNLNDFNIWHVPGAGGDLARMMGNLWEAENNRYVFTPKRSLPRLSFVAVPPESINWPTMGSLPVPEKNFMTTLNPYAHQEVIICGDSFGVELQPFLGLCFRQVILDRNFPEALPETNDRPVLVIEEMVERHIH